MVKKKSPPAKKMSDEDRMAERRRTFQVISGGKAPAIIKRDKVRIYWEEVLQVSHSRLKVWRRCQMQHHYRYYQRLRKIRNGTPLFIGTGVHSMLEAQQIRGNWLPEYQAFEKEFKKMFKEEQEMLGDLPGMVKGIVQGYIDKYQDDGLIYVPRHRGRVAEIQVKVDLDSRTRILGFVDKFPQDEEGRNWVMDHKTCKSIPDEESRYADLQLLMYVKLLPHLGYPKPDGVIWDYIRKKPPTVPEVLKSGVISKAAKMDTTPKVYMEAVMKLPKEKRTATAMAEYEAFAKTLTGKEEKFYRRIYLPSPNQALVDNVFLDVLKTAEEIRTMGPTATVRNMTRDCKQCSYYSLCQAEVRGLDSDYIRKAEYTVKENLDAQEENQTRIVSGDDTESDSGAE